MKKKMVVALLLVFAFGIINQAMAEETKKSLNVNAQNVSKASKIIQQNRALFNDPETLRKFIALSKNMKKK